MKFPEKDRYDIENNLKYLRDVMINPLNPGSIYVYPGSVFVCYIRENGWTDFHEIFMKRRAWHTK